MRLIIPILFMTIFLTLLVWANIYLSRRFGYYFSVENISSLNFLFILTTLFMIGGLAGFTNSVSLSGTILYKIAAIIMGLVLYLLLSVLLVDLIALFVRIKPSSHGYIAISIAVLVSVYGILNAYNTRLKKLEIPVKGLTKEFTIMHFTDIHIGHFRGVKFLGNLVKMSNQQKPDIVVITGDLFDGKVRLKQAVLEPLAKLNSDTYFVDGNHDGYTGVEKVKSLVRKTGITVLENEVADLGEIQIVGLNHMLPDTTSAGMHATINRTTIKDVLPSLKIDANKPSILLHHSPDGVQYASKEGIDLYLAGHTHAGQLFPVTIINNFIFKFNKGLHDYNGTKIFVSQGAGTFGPPMRVGTRSEIVFIRLIPE